MITAKSAYLVGIKGVGMASLAECLLDAGLEVQGSDVADEFVTDKRLGELKIKIDVGFDAALPSDIDMIVFTGAHQAKQNPQVKQAMERGITTLCHAEALAQLFNDQAGIAVCGVGGKSSVSAMLAFVLDKLDVPLSYSVGVGKILGLDKIGSYNKNANWFVAEADEYAANPHETQRGKKLIPRFSYLKPQVIICTNLKYDHPDVYQDFEVTKQVFKQFFLNLKQDGVLIVNADNPELIELAQTVITDRPDISLVTFGEEGSADFRLDDYHTKDYQTSSQVLFAGKKHQLNLAVPGKFNVSNALSAVTCLVTLDLPASDILTAVSQFKSTQRRFELVGQDNGVTLFDDYAHHPHEIKAIFQTLIEQTPPENIVVAFQPHTFSRTRELFDEFVEVLSEIPRLVLMDIFPSAREAYDDQTTSGKLLEAVKVVSPSHSLSLVKDRQELYNYYQANLKPRDVFITLGAGDIYGVFELIGQENNHVK
jgi:UDP-N-acetylmuramate--alanine ligase